MNRNILKEIVIDQNELIRKKPAGIQRDILGVVKKSAKYPHATVISGIRRSGKSTLLVQLMNSLSSKDYYYFSFEDERLINFGVENFNDLYEIMIELYGPRKMFFLDEIQNAKSWENFVRRMQDREFKFFLTGSNASLLSRDLGTKLTGRNLIYEMYPFSFKEFLFFHKYKFDESVLFDTIKRAKIRKLFEKFLHFGGMPEYLQNEVADMIKRTYEDVLYRDIVVRYDIGDVKALRELALYYLSNAGNLISFNKLKEMLNLGNVSTVKSYTDYLEASYLFFTVNIFSYSVARQLIAPKKVYVVDNGFMENIAFQFSQNKGRYLENMVFVELKRRGKTIFYYKTKKGKEVDFALQKGREISELIQVCDNLSDFETKKRETDALFEAMEELGLHSGLLITSDEEDEIKKDKMSIKIVSAWQWLLK